MIMLKIACLENFGSERDKGGVGGFPLSPLRFSAAVRRRREWSWDELSSVSTIRFLNFPPFPESRATRKNRSRQDFSHDRFFYFWWFYKHVRRGGILVADIEEDTRVIRGTRGFTWHWTCHNPLSPRENCLRDIVLSRSKTLSLLSAYIKDKKRRIREFWATNPPLVEVKKLYIKLLCTIVC